MVSGKKQEGLIVQKRGNGVDAKGACQRVYPASPPPPPHPGTTKESLRPVGVHAPVVVAARRPQAERFPCGQNICVGITKFKKWLESEM